MPYGLTIKDFNPAPSTHIHTTHLIERQTARAPKRNALQRLLCMLDSWRGVLTQFPTSQATGKRARTCPQSADCEKTQPSDAQSLRTQFLSRLERSHRLVWVLKGNARPCCNADNRDKNSGHPNKVRQECFHNAENAFTKFLPDPTSAPTPSFGNGQKFPAALWIGRIRPRLKREALINTTLRRNPGPWECCPSELDQTAAGHYYAS